MQTIGLSSEMNAVSSALLGKEKTIGFVPTMGALHEGHLSLIRKAKATCDVVVASIFVNPTQFNDPKDFDRYPRTVAADLTLLQAEGCDYVFTPQQITEVFPSNYIAFDMDFGQFESVMEGVHRPSHFKGVANVVCRLFEIVTPTHSFFGLKDFQQYTIIKSMVAQKKLGTQIVGVPTCRAESGLALSSRNTLLDNAARVYAANIYAGLQFAQSNFQLFSLQEAKEKTLAFFKEKTAFELEYLEFADGETLQRLEESTISNSPMAFIALKLNGVRLIDNISLKLN